MFETVVTRIMVHSQTRWDWMGWSASVTQCVKYVELRAQPIPSQRSMCVNAPLIHVECRRAKRLRRQVTIHQN